MPRAILLYLQRRLPKYSNLVQGAIFKHHYLRTEAMHLYSECGGVLVIVPFNSSIQAHLYRLFKIINHEIRLFQDQKSTRVGFQDRLKGSETRNIFQLNCRACMLLCTRQNNIYHRGYCRIHTVPALNQIDPPTTIVTGVFLDIQKGLTICSCQDDLAKLSLALFSSIVENQIFSRRTDH